MGAAFWNCSKVPQTAEQHNQILVTLFTSNSHSSAYLQPREQNIR